MCVRNIKVYCTNGYKITQARNSPAIHQRPSIYYQDRSLP